MASHVELNPDDNVLGLSLGMKAMRLALTQKTHKVGTVRIPTGGDTDVIIGDGAQDGANRIDRDGNQLPLVDTSGIDKAAQDAQQKADAAAANATKNELFRLSQWDRNTHASALGNLVVEQPVQGGAKLGDRVAGIDAKTSQLVTQVAALTEAVKTLAESKGADPDQIAAAVEKAVKAKLDKLRITVMDGSDEK